MSKKIAFLLGSAATVLACGGGVDPEAASAPLTFEQFEAKAFKEPDTGVYVFNGDETADSREDLREHYLRYLETHRAVLAGQHGLGKRDQPLIVNRVRGQDDVWSSAQAQNLSYCINQSSFSPSEYGALVTAMNAAAGAWEGAARVNFVHNNSADASCRKNSPVVFTVRRVCVGQYLARAFFPSSRQKEILVDCTAFGNIKPWSLTGVLTHELGHTIGLRHEHTRPESGTCFEDNSWRALTPYDSASVMHYPQCNGTNNGDLSLTTNDRAGAGILYP